MKPLPFLCNVSGKTLNLYMCVCNYFNFDCSSLLLGLPSSCGKQASHRSGFCHCRAGALELEGFSGCGSQALELRLTVGALGLGCLVTRGIFYRPGIKLVSPALAGGFFSHQPPGKPYFILFYLNFEELRRKVDAGETWGTFKRGTPRRHLGRELWSA